LLQDTRIYDISPKAELVKFKGKVTWAQLENPNKFGNWSLNLYPDPDSLERLRALTLKNVFKKDDDGYYMQVSRQTMIEFAKGVETRVTPPKIAMVDGSPIAQQIGDGSICEITCELRKYKIPNSEKFGNAIRLYSVAVEDLVPSQFTKGEWDGKTS
jgi:hypothetical protein